MSERLHALAQHLLGKSSVEECSIEELQHLTKRYPFFAPAQFLLLQKLKETGSPDIETQQRKAVLYYHDPLQFDHFVSSDKFHFDEASFSRETIAASPELNETTSFDEVLPAEEVISEEQSFLQQDNDETGEPDNVASLTPEEETPLPVEEQEETKKEIVTSFHQPDLLTGEEGLEEENILVEETPLSEGQEDAKEPVEDDAPEVIGANEEETDSSETSTAKEPQAVQFSEEITGSKTADSTHNGGIQINAPALAGGGAALSENASPLLFEPFHTVDYFASQGIKISAEELPKDKLGKQLRSFTEWLRIMKRLPATQMAQSPETSAEKNVENLASHSVVESHVVTEAMAEVWAKQGARDKAIETYNKLSLLNPSKKAYFAAKIENLKQS